MKDAYLTSNDMRSGAQGWSQIAIPFWIG